MASKVLVCRFPRPDAAVKLFCFPWAGGGANFYSNWGNKFPDSIEIHGVCLAGREGRYKDPVYNSLLDILDDVCAAIHSACKGKPFALWGHSLGSYLTYETACTLKERYNMEPVHVFVSGASAPHSEKRKQKTIDVKNYTDDEFIELLKHFGGTPADIIENKDVISFFLPALRADYELLPEIRSTDPRERCVLKCPVDVFDGTDDTPHDLEAWRDISTGHCTITKLNGGHFYLKDQSNMEKLIKHICCALEPSPL